MAKLKVTGIVITKDHKNDKVLYHKDGKYYIRTAKDGFTKGEPIRQHVASYYVKWGFREIEGGGIDFRDGADIQQNIDRFEKRPGFKVKYRDRLEVRV